MNNLIIDNHVISKNISAILTKVTSQIKSNKLKSIKFSVNNVRVTCPHHKDGEENKPSCDIYIGDDENLTWGTAHCFTCGFSGPLYHFIGECFDKSDNFGKKWLKDNFTESVISVENIDLEPLVLSEIKKQDISINESVLESFQSWHPYMLQRKLSKEICSKYEVMYDPKTESLVFPVRDVKGNLSFLTRRNVNNKTFIIDSSVNKPVYLLYDAINNHSKEVYVCESQINALTLASWGYQAIALFGTGTKYQYDLLNKTDILTYHLCFDGDEAGYKGIDRFIKNIKKNVFVDIIEIPKTKDVNDLTKEEFEKLNIIESYSWIKA